MVRIEPLCGPHRVAMFVKPVMSSINEKPENLRVRIFQAPSRPALQSIMNEWLEKPDVPVGEVVSVDLTARGSALCAMVTFTLPR